MSRHKKHKKLTFRHPENPESKIKGYFLNRSTRLEGKKGFYNGVQIESRYVSLEPEQIQLLTSSF